MPVDVKICGLTTPETCLAAAEAGAAYLGFMFYPPSPRALTINAAEALRPELPDGPARVGVFVDPDDALIDAAVAALELDWIQLHGKETVERISDLKTRTGLKIMRACGVSTYEDIESAQIYYPAVNAMLFDAKPPKGAILPGGNAVSFPWEILQNAPLPNNWLLAGGLKADNLAEAAKVSQAKILDVSSGVEESPGVKSVSAIKAFLNAAKAVR